MNLTMRNIKEIIIHCSDTEEGRNISIALAFVGEILGLDIGDVLSDSIGHDGGEVGIAARVLRIKWFSGKIISIIVNSLY